MRWCLVWWWLYWSRLLWHYIGWSWLDHCIWLHIVRCCRRRCRFGGCDILHALWILVKLVIHCWSSLRLHRLHWLHWLHRLLSRNVCWWHGRVVHIVNWCYTCRWHHHLTTSTTTGRSWIINWWTTWRHHHWLGWRHHVCLWIVCWWRQHCWLSSTFIKWIL